MFFIFRFLLKRGIKGITLFPFVFFASEELRENETLVNHEKIHLRQQLETLIIPFYILYLLEYVAGLIKYKDGYKAYKNISFEREAFEHENDPNYLKNRKLWAFTKYQNGLFSNKKS